MLRSGSFLERIIPAAVLRLDCRAESEQAERLGEQSEDHCCKAERWLDSRCDLQITPIGFADGWDVACERSRNDFKVLGLSNGKIEFAIYWDRKECGRSRLAGRKSVQ